MPEHLQDSITYLFISSVIDDIGKVSGWPSPHLLTLVLQRAQLVQALTLLAVLNHQGSKLLLQRGQLLLHL